MRDQGLLQISANFEPKIAAPFDSRQIIQQKSDLILPDTFGLFHYKGMIVSVVNDAISDNNGVYVLLGANHLALGSWIKISGSSVPSSVIVEKFSFYSNRIHSGFSSISSINYSSDEHVVDTISLITRLKYSVYATSTKTIHILKNRTSIYSFSLSQETGFIDLMLPIDTNDKLSYYFDGSGDPLLNVKLDLTLREL